MKALKQDDAALLFGRDDEIARIVADCRAERLSVVSAEPGLGVTSMLEAGLFPALRSSGFIVAIFRDWQGRFFVTHLKEAIADAVRQQADPLFFAQGEELEEMFDRIRGISGKQVVVLLDQFEDYVRCHQNTVLSDAFDAELSTAVTKRKGVLVIGMQEHALPEFERLRQHIPNLLGYHTVLQPITMQAARDAVVAEARAIELEVEPEALNALVTAPIVIRPRPEPEQEPVITAATKVHPFYLKVASGILLDAEARVKSPAVRFATIEVRGGVDKIVNSALDGMLGELGTTQTDLLFRWCNLLISPAKHRLAVTEKGLTEYAGKLNRFVPGLLEHLTGAGLLRPVEAGDTVRYEIARECYAPVLRDWWERREAMIVARRRAIFRITSISLAVSAIVLAYIVWLIFGR